MKKSLLLLAAAFVAVSSFAQNVKIDFANGVTMFGLPGASSGNGNTYVADGEITEPKTAVVDGVTITVNPAAEGAATPNRIWATAPQLRLYSNTLTLSAEQTFSKVVFNLHTAPSNAKWGANTVNTGTLSSYVAKQSTSVTWIGETNELVLSVASNTQISSIVVTLGEGGETPTLKDPSNTAETAYTAAQAIAIIDAAEEYDLTKQVFVQGKVTGNVEIEVENYGNATFDIEEGFKIFRCSDIDGAKFTDAEKIKVGDTVVVKGILTLYTKGDTKTYELTKAQLVSVTSGVPTSIEALKANNDNAKAYDLSGRAVKKQAKGVVIINGKKVVR